MTIYDNNILISSPTISNITTTTASHNFLPKSQVVIAGAVDANGCANFLSTSSGGVKISATTTPVLIAYANGQDIYGHKNYIEQINADTSSTWGILPAGTNYLYKELNTSTGISIYGSSLECPDYVTADNQSQHSIMHLEANSDEYGHAWTLANGAFSAKTHAGFGTNALNLTGGNTYLKNSTLGLSRYFTCEFFFMFNSVASNQIILITENGYGVRFLYITASGKIEIKLSSNGSSYNILDAVGTKSSFSINTWYHFAFVSDGATFKLYIDGTLDNSATSANALTIGAGVWGLGYSSSAINGWMDEFRYSNFARYTGNFTAPTAPFTKDTSIYNITLRKFPYIGTNKLRVYLGEAVSNGTTVSSVITYALNGEYEYTQNPCPATNTSVSMNHYIGTKKLNFESVLENLTAELGFTIGDRTYWDSFSVVPQRYVVALTSKNATLNVGYTYIVVGRKDNGAPCTIITPGNWKLLVSIKRSF
jgi:hypothetical protein